MTPVPELERFADLMEPAVIRAAKLARSLEGRVRNRPKPGEETRVKQALTEADTAAQETVLEDLRIHYPGVSLEAEEDTPLVEHFPKGSDSLVIIDPIDGTLHSYLEGGGPYAVIVGLAFQRVLCSALVALPREGLCFAATAGQGARMTRSGASARRARVQDGGSRVLVSHGMPERVVDHLVAQGLDVIPACGGAVSVAPLIPGVRAGLRYATGERGVSVRGRVGALIAAEAGVGVRGDGGRPFPLNLDTPSRTLRVATREADHKLLQDALAAAALA
jgi:hypothetical protein